MESNQRSYGNDESILVCEAWSYNFTTKIFDSVSVNYKRTIIEEVPVTTGNLRRPNQVKQIRRDVIESFHSLQSALTDGCDYAHLGDRISFSDEYHLQKDEKAFILPLILYTQS